MAFVKKQAVTPGTVSIQTSTTSTEPIKTLCKMELPEGGTRNYYSNNSRPTTHPVMTLGPWPTQLPKKRKERKEEYARKLIPDLLAKDMILTCANRSCKAMDDHKLSGPYMLRVVMGGHKRLTYAKCTGCLTKE